MPKCQRWTWAAKLNPNQLTEQHLFAAYSLNFDNLCKTDSCRRNCKKVLCIGCFDKSWIDSPHHQTNSDSIETIDECDQKRSDLKSFVGLKNLGATCYVNCLLQLWFHNPALRKAIYLWNNQQSGTDTGKQQQLQPLAYNERNLETATPSKQALSSSSSPSSLSSSQDERIVGCSTTVPISNHDRNKHADSADIASTKCRNQAKEEEAERSEREDKNSLTAPNNDNNKQDHNKLQSNPIQQLQLIFARLQFTNKQSIDPSNFIESLALNAAEQQDAQEFGNLFMEFLEKSFADQNNDFVSSVIQRQFCGSYSYATICDTCKHSSLSESKFYELDLSIQRMETLNDCLDEFFRPVPLDGKYNCSHCQKASSAHRKIILKSLPPTLNLQLLRFIYDVQRNVRQKLNSYITFPEVLDMSPYFDSSSQPTRQSRSMNGSSQPHVYILTAVLIHRGSSPHSGHYIAHIKDRSSQDWYKFNDDSVERIGPELHVPTDGESVTVVEGDARLACLKLDESVRQRMNLMTTHNLKSKTAYMLVYQAHDNEALTYPTDHSNEWDLPEHLATAVVEENSRCDELFESLKLARDMDRKMIEERKSQIRIIYERLLCTSPSDNFEFIDKKWLQDWLTNSTTEAKFMPICNKKFLCIHNKLDFRKIDHVKCVKSEGADILYREFGGGPRLKDALCKDCVEVEVCHYQLRERMKEDQKFIVSQAKFKISSDTPFEDCYCVGKDSYRDWQRLVVHQFEQKYPEIKKPKVSSNQTRPETDSNVENKSDQSTKETNKVVALNDDEDDTSSDDNDSLDSFQFNSDLLCEHDRLTQELSNWRIVPKEVWAVFERYFSNGDLNNHLIKFTAAEPLCEDCKHEELKMLEIGDVKKQTAAVIKSKLTDLFYNRKRASWCSMLPGDVFYALDRQFLSKWQKFLRNPCSQEEPTMITNRERLFCSHDRSLYYHGNSNPVLPECPFILVTPNEWRILKEHYNHDAELSFVVDPDLAAAKKVFTLGEKANEIATKQSNNNGSMNLESNGMQIDDSVQDEDDEIELSDLDWSDCVISDPEYCSKCHEILKEDELKKLLNYESATIYITKVENNSIMKHNANNSELTNGSACVSETNHCDKSSGVGRSLIASFDAPHGRAKLDSGDLEDDGIHGSKRRKKMDIEDETTDFIPPGAKQTAVTPTQTNSMLRRTTRRNRSREQAYTVKPTQTLLQLKKEIFNRCQVLPMDQRLFINDLLLEDNNKTMSDLRIIPNSSLRLEVDKPISDTIDLIEDEPQARKSCKLLQEFLIDGRQSP